MKKSEIKIDVLIDESNGFYNINSIERDGIKVTNPEEIQSIESGIRAHITDTMNKNVMPTIEVGKVYYARLGSRTPYILVTKVENNQVFGRVAETKYKEFSKEETLIFEPYRLIKKVEPDNDNSNIASALKRKM